MGVLIKRNIALLRFSIEALKCQTSKEQMNIHYFEDEINDLINTAHARLGNLLPRDFFAQNATLPYVDRKASDANRLVFFNLFNEAERYMLADGEISALSGACSLDIDMINREKGEELAKVWEFYKKIYELLGIVRNIPLTGNLSFDYSFADGCYYALRDKLGNISKIYEIEEDDRGPDTESQFYINKGLPIATIEYRHMDEIAKIKNEVEELWRILAPSDQDIKTEKVLKPTTETKK